MAKHLLLPLIGLFLLASPLRADIGSVLPAGDLEQWAVLTLGLNGLGDRLLNGAEVNGDIAVAGNGNIALAGNAFVDGDIYFSQRGMFRMGAGADITGSQNRGANALLKTESGLALDLSRAAGVLAPTRNLSMIDLNGTSNLTLSGAPGETVVLSLRMIRMTGDSTLTLQGSANTTYVINVNRGFSTDRRCQDRFERRDRLERCCVQCPRAWSCGHNCRHFQLPGNSPCQQADGATTRFGDRSR